MMCQQVAGRTKSLFSTMKKLLRLDSIGSGGRAKQEVHDILASRCIVTPHPDLHPDQAEDLACQVRCCWDPIHAAKKNKKTTFTCFSQPTRLITCATQQQ